MPKYSLIIPVYNRPEEVDELLGSLVHQQFKDFEVLIVEDGSTKPCKEVTEKYTALLDLRYLAKDNSGPGPTRNYGAEHASSDYLIFLDSDCIIPPLYLQHVHDFLGSSFHHCFGGPDKAHADFSPMQKAVNYAMTSFITTGGIRGGKKKISRFVPRSFNMGYSREVFKKTGGYKAIRYGEDIDMSLRIEQTGYSAVLIEDAFVYHKRRTDLGKFFRQVNHSGKARWMLQKLHPGSLKLVHLLPSAFTLGLFSLVFLGIFYPPAMFLIAFFCISVFIDSTLQNKSIKIGLLSIATSLTQLVGYGTGFLQAFLNN